MIAERRARRALDPSDYLPLVRAIARRIYQITPLSVQLDDLIQEGCIGLLRAHARYDPSRGVKFNTYLYRRVHGSMLDFLRREDAIPRTVRRMVRDGKLAEPLVCRMLSLSTPLTDEFDENTLTLSDMLPAPPSECDERIDDRALVDRLFPAENGRMTVVARLWANGHTQAEIGRFLGVSATLISKILSRAFDAARQAAQEPAQGVERAGRVPGPESDPERVLTH